MENVKIFLGGGHPDWRKIGHGLQEKGFDVRSTKADADVSIVLSGMGINSLCLTGKKILVYSASEWMSNIPVPHGFNMYKPVLDEYYDDFIDITSMAMSDAIEKITDYIRQAGRCNEVS